jgi:glucose/arabinose dehydrogenase
VPAQSATVTARTVVDTGTVFPAAFGVASDGRVFFGAVWDPSLRVWSPSTRRTTTFATIPLGRRVLGMTLHPDFPSTPYIYAYAERRLSTGNRLQIVRYTAGSGGATGFRVLRDVAPRGTDHHGGKLIFSPNKRYLWLVTGDGGTPASAQDLSSTNGKVLRLTPTGANVSGNLRGPIYAYGFRNSIGLTFDPKTGNLWETDNGPECGDELNLVRAGGNYGWGPSATCGAGAEGTNRDGPSVRMPAKWYADPIAPTGATFCVRCGLPSAEGQLLFGQYLGNQLRRVTLDTSRTSVVREDLLYQNSAPVIDVVTAPDRSIWFSDTGSIKRLVLR